jgi:chemotaxis protein methyltransferase CheR
MGAAPCGQCSFGHVRFASAPRLRGPAMDLSPRPSRSVVEHSSTLLTSEDEVFLRWLLEQAGLNFEHYRPECLSRRLTACLRVLRAVSAAHARWLIDRSPRLLPLAIDTLLIGVSSFFRDPPVFDHLRPLLAQMARQGRVQRIWSVGCSDGQELYSIAFLLAELGVLHRFYLLGTDCRSEAVQRASRGAYHPTALRGLPAAHAGYFRYDGERFRVQSWLRACLTWRCGSFVRAVEPGTWDLVLCRNMLIYLSPDAGAAVSRQLQRLLSPRGILVMGKAERPAGDRLLKIGPCIFGRPNEWGEN